MQAGTYRHRERTRELCFHVFLFLSPFACVSLNSNFFFLSPFWLTPNAALFPAIFFFFLFFYYYYLCASQTGPTSPDITGLAEASQDRHGSSSGLLPFSDTSQTGQTIPDNYRSSVQTSPDRHGSGPSQTVVLGMSAPSIRLKDGMDIQAQRDSRGVHSFTKIHKFLLLLLIEKKTFSFQWLLCCCPPLPGRPCSWFAAGSACTAEKSRVITRPPLPQVFTGTQTPRENTNRRRALFWNPSPISARFFPQLFLQSWQVWRRFAV
mmetsp:Transcript_30561/g.60061  ORF Transcript_30561/g.60061 Transcript_30561/m.60061 type:complete len:264 (-) Transcript_30561:14-805(-)